MMEAKSCVNTWSGIGSLSPTEAILRAPVVKPQSIPILMGGFSQDEYP